MHQNIWEPQLVPQSIGDLMSDTVGLCQRQIAPDLHMEIGMAALGPLPRSDLVNGDDAGNLEGHRLDLLGRPDGSIRQQQTVVSEDFESRPGDHEDDDYGSDQIELWIAETRSHQTDDDSQ